MGALFSAEVFGWAEAVGGLDGRWLAEVIGGCGRGGRRLWADVMGGGWRR